MSFYPTRRFLAVALLGAAMAAPAASSGGGLPFLLDLPGIATLVRYVPGGLDRAAHAQLRFEFLIDDYRQWTGNRKRQTLFVLDREAWEGLGSEVPYGMPMRIADGVALASEGDDGTVALWKGLVGDAIPTSATGSGMALRNSPAEVGSLALHDMLAEVEIARRLVGQSEFSGESGWIDELIVHTVARTAFLRHEEGRLEEIDEIFDRLRDLRPGALELVDGATPPTRSLEEWLAYQGRYFAGARLIADKDGLAAVKKLHKLTSGGEKRLTRAALGKRYPDLSQWLETSFQE